MTNEEIQDIEDMLDGKSMLDEDEIIYWMFKDIRKLIKEVRSLKELLRLERLKNE